MSDRALAEAFCGNKSQCARVGAIEFDSADTAAILASLNEKEDEVVLVLRVGSQETRQTADLPLKGIIDIEAKLAAGEFTLPGGEAACSAALLFKGKIIETFGYFSNEAEQEATMVASQSSRE
ncbi:hypothetical protein WMC41_09880 [Shinella yambaruensis]|uniref:hypothetical protein n=1 Tax=Shinella yambaruensis TaxID=415996 RepID=UPI003D7BEAB8